ncbi:hypothetical protein FRB96_005811 [Tulasnella sp. 330]|nr:hypothetical protein FRB96_005811 [Tulasnella sp. 330]
MASPQSRASLLARRLASRQTGSTIRSFTASRLALTDAPVIVDATTVRPKKPIGGFRGGIFGFLLGFSVASAYASYRLLEEYKIASALLQASVEDLQSSTDKVSTHIRRIEAVETNLKALSEATSTKEDHKKVRAEMRRLYDGLHVEQDLHTLTKAESTSLRPS